MDIDEFLDVDARKLRLWTAVGVTAARTVGFHMVGASRDLTAVTRGLRDVAENKAALYRPAPDRRLNSDSGNHDARPQPMGGLVWAVLDMYHYTFTAPDAFGGLDDSVALPTDRSQGQIKAGGPDCWRHRVLSWWARDRDRAVDILGAPLEGLEPFPAHADRGLDVRAALADADASCVVTAYGDAVGEIVYDVRGGDRAWFWSRSQVGLRAHPPFHRPDGAGDRPDLWSAPDDAPVRL